MKSPRLAERCSCKSRAGRILSLLAVQGVPNAGISFIRGDALRKERNIGAHATGESVSRLDAQDVLDFAKAIAEYIYVMSAKFDEYQTRKAKLGATKGSPT